MASIAIKPNLGVNPTNGLSLGLHGLTRVNQEKLKRHILGFDILYEKIRNNPYGYRLYML